MTSMLRCSEAAACCSNLRWPLTPDQASFSRTKIVLCERHQGPDQFADPVAPARRNPKFQTALSLPKTRAAGS